jgi:hypothetical protein
MDCFPAPVLRTAGAVLVVVVSAAAASRYSFFDFLVGKRQQLIYDQVLLFYEDHYCCSCLLDFVLVAGGPIVDVYHVAVLDSLLVGCA